MKRAMAFLIFMLISSACGCGDEDNQQRISVEARLFADVHWDSTRYIDGLYYTFYRRDKPESIKDAWLDTTTYITTDNQSNITARSLSHHAWYKSDGSKVDRDEYYENIGKYNQFNFGWDDFPGLGTDSFPDHPDDTMLQYVSPMRKLYMDLADL